MSKAKPPDQKNTSLQPAGGFVEQFEVGQPSIVLRPALGGFRDPDPGSLAYGSLHKRLHRDSDDRDHSDERCVKLKPQPQLRFYLVMIALQESTETSGHGDADEDAPVLELPPGERREISLPTWPSRSSCRRTRGRLLLSVSRIAQLDLLEVVCGCQSWLDPEVVSMTR